MPHYYHQQCLWTCRYPFHRCQASRHSLGYKLAGARSWAREAQAQIQTLHPERPKCHQVVGPWARPYLRLVCTLALLSVAWAEAQFSYSRKAHPSPLNSLGPFLVFPFLLPVAIFFPFSTRHARALPPFPSAISLDVPAYPAKAYTSPKPHAQALSCHPLQPARLPSLMPRQRLAILFNLYIMRGSTHHPVRGPYTSVTPTMCMTCSRHRKYHKGPKKRVRPPSHSVRLSSYDRVSP